MLADGDANQMYGFTARALLAINKYFAATPFYRIENMQELFGTPITASTQYDQCAAVAFACEPIYEALLKTAAQASSISVDDTHNKILQKEAKLKPNRTKKGETLRSGVYSSCMIACNGQHYIIIYNTDIGHSGELADAVLKHRDEEKPPPNYMGDASSNNTVTVCVVQRSLCNSHARRQFYDIENNYPDEVGWLLEQYGKVWHHDTESEDLGHTPAERLSYHKEHSSPTMEKIRQWCEESLSTEDAEHYSGLGKAQKYFLKHYDGLTGFCQFEGALIDNNQTEQALKLIIRSRKNSMFYKSEKGAEVANILTSVVATCAQNNVNAFEYLVWIQQNRVALKANPELYLPWHFKSSSQQSETETADTA